MRLANDSAADVYSADFAASPVFVAWSAMSTAWRALPDTFSSSSMARFRRISVCFWFAITLAACCVRRLCCSCASAMACSSCTLGSARSSNDPPNRATVYFHQRFRTFSMRRS